MKSDNKSASRGFTLIELLVVVGIIGLLTAIVLAAVSSARTLAKNSSTSQAIEQYRNALEIYNLEHGTYPVLEDEEWHCLGTGYTIGCGWMNNPAQIFTPSNMLDTSLAGLIGSYTFNLQPLSFYDDTFLGAIYVCTDVQNGVCGNVGIEWILSGIRSSCNVSGSYAIPDYINNTLCYVLLKGDPGAAPPP